MDYFRFQLHLSQIAIIVRRKRNTQVLRIFVLTFFEKQDSLLDLIDVFMNNIMHIMYLMYLQYKDIIIITT